MKIILSHRLAQIKPSPTLSLSAAANRLKANGKPIINLTVGEPDFDTPAHIVEAGFAAIRSGDTHYPPAFGTPALLEAISASTSVPSRG